MKRNGILDSGEVYFIIMTLLIFIGIYISAVGK